jgi:hypothetical protein
MLRRGHSRELPGTTAPRRVNSSAADTPSPGAENGHATAAAPDDALQVRSGSPGEELDLSISGLLLPPKTDVRADWPVVPLVPIGKAQRYILERELPAREPWPALNGSASAVGGQHSKHKPRRRR